MISPFAATWMKTQSKSGSTRLRSFHPAMIAAAATMSSHAAGSGTAPAMIGVLGVDS